MGCSGCGGGKKTQPIIVQTIDKRIKDAAKIYQTVFSGGDVEQGIKRAEICKGCTELTDYDGLAKLNFDMLELAGSWAVSQIPAIDASKVKKAVPEIKGKYCGPCGCVAALKVLTEIEVVRNDKGEITNSEQIQKDTCPIGLWSFNKIGEEY